MRHRRILLILADNCFSVTTDIASTICASLSLASLPVFFLRSSPISPLVDERTVHVMVDGVDAHGGSAPGACAMAKTRDDDGLDKKKTVLPVP